MSRLQRALQTFYVLRTVLPDQDSNRAQGPTYVLPFLIMDSLLLFQFTKPHLALEVVRVHRWPHIEAQR
ncbi:hypothetical protein EON80_29115 [bacterium]|nr:MAG: hypothetical protein EON80_29115 [bacterium]